MARDGRGWHNDSARHAMAAKGIKTGRKMPMKRGSPNSEREVKILEGSASGRYFDDGYGFQFWYDIDVTEWRFADPKKPDKRLLLIDGWTQKQVEDNRSKIVERLETELGSDEADMLIAQVLGDEAPSDEERFEELTDRFSDELSDLGLLDNLELLHDQMDSLSFEDLVQFEGVEVENKRTGVESDPDFRPPLEAT